ncbi:MAG TPA: patatin-like phospholipase family protein [Ignavibacteriaceae bacterium]|nr:patatin-like phospholipase family protein [Ignavibacteriaceae bacterium]
MYKKIKILLLFVLIPELIFAQLNKSISLEYTSKLLPFGLEYKEPVAKPFVALALSGGGVRGFAQIGVLKVLEENKIPFSILTGTSMGSIMGGLYASGYSIAQLESIAVNTNWTQLFTTTRETDRKDLFVDQKITDDRAIFTLRIKGLTPIIPTSINTGQRFSNFLHLLTLQAPIHVNSKFDELLYKFRAVCTDLVSGKTVIIENGSLSQAMRASSSVSFFLPPVKIDSLLLVDGGLVANIPVNVSRDLGSEYVIAVNTTGSLYKEEELVYPWTVADQILSIPMRLLNESQLQNANAIISPDLKGKLSSDFTNIDSLIDVGYKSTLPIVNKIKNDVDSILMKKLGGDSIYYKNVIIHSIEDSITFKYLSQYAAVDSVSECRIKKDLYNEYLTGNYKNLRADITQLNGTTIVKFIYELNPLIKEVQVYGVSLFNKDSVDNIFKSLLNKSYNARNIFNKAIEFLSLYRSKGYSLAELENIKFDDTTGVLVLNLNEGVVSKVLIQGNEKTIASIILREIPLKEGEVFLYDKVSQGLTNLRSTNLFDDIILNIQREYGKFFLIVKVLERTTNLIRIGFRADDENKAQFNLDIRDENFFGQGSELGLNLLGGTRNRAYVLEMKSNRILNTYFTYKINAYWNFNDVYLYKNVPTQSDRKVSREIFGEYRQIYYGASFSLGSQVQRFGSLIFKGTFEYNDIKNKRGNYINFDKIKLVNFKVIGTIDTQDKYPYTTSGFYFIGGYETAQKIFGGSVGYTNLWLDYRSNFTFKTDHTITPHISIGIGDNALPLTQLYSLGGQNSFFGMREEEYRGRQLFVTSLEYRYKFPFRVFFDTYAKFRYDLGSIWDLQERIKFKDFKHGVGGSLSFDTPIGPADFSIGRLFLINRGLKSNPIVLGDVNFYFSIGFFY